MIFCAVLFVCSAFVAIPPAHAQIPYRGLGTVTSLRTGLHEYFSPTYITCRIGYSCVTIINRTRHPVSLYDSRRVFWGTVYPVQMSQTFIYYRPGTYTVTFPGNYVRVP